MDAIICAEIIYLLSVKKQDLHTDHTEGNSLNSWISLDFELCTQYGSIMYAPAQIHFARFVQKGSEIDDGMAFPCFSHKVTRTLNTLKQYPVCLVSWTCSPCHLVKRNAKNQPILPSLGIQGIRQAWDVWHEPAPSHALDHGTYVGVFCVSSTTELNIMGALSGVL